MTVELLQSLWDWRDVFVLPARWSVQHVLLVPAMQGSKFNTATQSLGWEVSGV